MLINQPFSSPLFKFDELFLIYDRLFNPHYVRWDQQQIGVKITGSAAPTPPPPAPAPPGVPLDDSGNRTTITPNVPLCNEQQGHSGGGGAVGVLTY